MLRKKKKKEFNPVAILRLTSKNISTIRKKLHNIHGKSLFLRTPEPVAFHRQLCELCDRAFVIRPTLERTFSYTNVTSEVVRVRVLYPS